MINMIGLKASDKIKTANAAPEPEEKDQPETDFETLLAGACVLPPVPGQNAEPETAPSDSSGASGVSDRELNLPKSSESALPQTMSAQQSGLAPADEFSVSPETNEKLDPAMTGPQIALSEHLAPGAPEILPPLSEVVKAHTINKDNETGVKTEILPGENQTGTNNHENSTASRFSPIAGDTYAHYPWESSPQKPIFQTAQTAEAVGPPADGGRPLGRLPELFREINEILQIENQTAAQSQEVVKTETAQILKGNAVSQIEPQLLRLAGLVEKKGDKQILRMRLHPAELGTVEIKLEKNSSGTLDAHLQTENEAAARALSSGLDELRQTLEAAGWQIGRLEISQNNFSFSEQTPSDQPREQSETGGNSLSDNSFERIMGKSDDARQIQANRLVSLRA